MRFFEAKMAAQKAAGTWAQAQKEARAKEEAEFEEYDRDCELLKGKVCITGKLTYPRHEYEGWIKDFGGTAVSGVSKTTNVLIAGDDAGSKLKKVQELGIPVMSDAKALSILEDVYSEISDAWAQRIVERLIESVKVTDTDGYFTLTDKERTQVLEATDIEELRDWLLGDIGVDSDNAVYTSFEDAMALRLTWIKLNPVNNVTAWYYDNECGSVDEPQIKAFNTNQEAREFLNEQSHAWGGHLSTIKVVHKTGDTIKVAVGDELSKARYPFWDWQWAQIPDYLESYPELAALMPDNPEDALEELNEIVRKGLWPLQK